MKDAPDPGAHDVIGGGDAVSDHVLSEARNWFLRHGLPSAIPFRQRWHHVVQRSAPALAGWASLMVSSVLVSILSGDVDVDVDDDPSMAQWLALLILVCIPATVLLVGWASSRIDGVRARTVVAVAAMVIGVVSDWWDDDDLDVIADVLGDGLVIVLILAATGSGVGAILGWAARTTLGHLRAAGRLMVRALPVLLLTVLAFFNTTVWLVATDLSVPRIVVFISFLALIAVSFLTAGAGDSLATVTARDDQDAEDLSGTPFAAIDPRAGAPALRLSERINLLLVVVVSQIVQVLLLAFLTGILFFIMGLIVLNPAVLNRLTNGGTAQTVLFDFTLPVSAAHVHVTAILTALTFMYVSAKAVGDGEYRKNFLDPMLAELRLAVTARHRYRAALAQGRPRA